MDATPGSSPPTAFGRLAAGWVYGGFLAGIVFLLLAPVFLVGFALPFVMVVLQLPLYMIHQYEEHDADRFRAFVNEHVGGGREVLSPAAVFVINIGGVWLLDALCIWLAATVNLGLGLIAVYAALVNALVHIAVGVAARRYNPGLVTAVLLLLPVGGVGAWVVSRTGTVGVGYHALGIVAAVVLHGAIVGYVLRERRRLAGV